MERAMGIEPTSEAWEAGNITQKHAGLAAFLRFSERLNWKIMENGKWLSSSMTAAMLPSLIVHAEAVGGIASLRRKSSCFWSDPNLPI
ncbi:MAG: hypothetical protein DMG41_02120 [Acidobacteria bacterium]|nr:MAG: hypothetical protein DMG41_02120 [Acidobacteriota bacterium]